MKKNNKSEAAYFLIGCIIGLLIFFVIFGFECVNFTNDSFIINGYIEKDIAQHYAGWMLYRDSPWQFPLGVGQNISYPFGSSVSYTDSIPLFAIIFKCFRNILPETFQYFGLYNMLAFMLQGGFAGLLASLFTSSVLANSLISAIFVFSPIMLERAFRHTSLTSHFFILASLYFYFKNKGKSDIKSVIPFFIINALVITIHPYFMPFTFGIMFAFCIEIFFKERKYSKSVLYVLRSMIITLLIGYIIGAFYIGGSMAQYGYGKFSMNLNAFFNPTSNGFDNWSKFLNNRPYAFYQIEGFNYLGLGILLFIIPAVFLIIFKKRKSGILNLIYQNFGLLLSTLILFVFSIGDWICFDSTQIIRLPIPQFLINSLFGMFRANGRFGWLLVYSIVILIIYSVSLINSKKLKIILLSLILIIQSVDISGALISKHAYFTGSNGDLQKQNSKILLHNTFWDDLADKYDVCHMVSTFIPNSIVDIAVKMGKSNHAVNSSFEARLDIDRIISYNASLLEDIKNGQLSSDSIIIVNILDEELINGAAEHGYSIYFVENVYAICESLFSEEEINNYISQGNFEVLI